MTQTQTLSSAPSSSSFFEELGGSTVSVTPEPRKQIMLVLGRPGKGKSYFAQDIPGAFIINPDLTSTVNRSGRSAVWPMVRKDGRPVEVRAGQRRLSDGRPDPDDATPVQMSWSLVTSKIEQLVKLAAENKPRPEVIVIDTVDALYGLVQQHMVDDANRNLHPNQPKKEDFGDLFGKSAWPLSYKYVIHEVDKLRNAGYGVVLLCQLGDKTVYVGPEGKQETIIQTNRPRLPDNLWHQLTQKAETIMWVHADKETRGVETPLLNPDGTERTDPKTGKVRMIQKSEEVEVRFISFQIKQLEDRVKKRLPLPDRIDLGRHPWDDFEREYLKASC